MEIITDFCHGNGERLDVSPVSLPEGGSYCFAVIENEAFVSGCIARAVSAYFRSITSVYSTAAEFVRQEEAPKPVVVILSSADRTNTAIYSDLELINEASPTNRTIVLGQRDEPETALFAIGHGAKGYIPTSTGWDIAIEAIRFVAVGGTYVPAEYVMASRAFGLTAWRAVEVGDMTERERMVLRAIGQGKRNKGIANELRVSESTIKAHVRHIMSKSHVRNRTELALRAEAILDGAIPGQVRGANWQPVERVMRPTDRREAKSPRSAG